MMGRASHTVGADVYLGAREASALIGRWEGRGGMGRGGFGGGRFEQRGWEGRGGMGRGGFGGGRFEQRGQRGRAENFGGQGFEIEGQGQRHHHRHREMEKEQWEAQHPGQDWYEREERKRQWEQSNPGVPFVGMEALMGALEESAEAAGIHPRAALVNARPPNMANREPLPMSTGTAPVGIGLTAQITSRPQRIGFRPERLFVSNYSLDGLGATAWTINDITIGNVSQLAQAGNLPGDMFANVAIDSFVTFKTAQTAMDVVLITTYNGTTEGGIPFTGAVIGLSAQSG